MTARERFLSKVDRTGECWEWTASRNPQGYGYFWDGERERMVLAHRFAYEMWVAPLPNEPGRLGPPSVTVCHHCDNPSCVNPGHLFVGTQADNMQDMRTKGRGPRCKGAANANARLTPESVAAIRAGYTGRHGQQSELAARYGVDPTTIRRAALGETWRAEA